jgi:hypothetical protein
MPMGAKLMSEDSDNTSTGIDYEILVEEALRDVVKSALKIAEKSGLPNDAHFYISFKTQFSGVEMDSSLRAINPEEMTVVMQHQYWDLIVSDELFCVTLSFSGVKQSLVIPFAAVTHFTDPSVGFGLQFSANDETSSTELSEFITSIEDKNKIDSTDASETDSADVVSLDAFRKQPSRPT